MYYSLISLLALLVLIIMNHDVLLNRRSSDAPPVQRVYRLFLLAVSFYYITDMLWGVLDALGWMTLLYVDTELYFFAMAFGFLEWTQYVNAYLEYKSRLRPILSYTGVAIAALIALLTVLNLFFPLMFWFDEAGRYQTGLARDIALLSQVAILFLTSVHVLRISEHTSGAQRNRHVTVGAFGVIMLTLISIQFFQPLLPLYAIGYMLGCCLLHTFVVENEKEEYRRDLEVALEREKQGREELRTAWTLAYTDSLTGVNSRLAFAEKEGGLDRAISEGKAEKVAVVVCDLNGLKQINDVEGHEAGDHCIIEASRLICEVFPHSPTYRVGGDEFAVLLEGRDYEKRDELLRVFFRHAEHNRETGGVVVAAGMAEYDPARDNSFRRVFERADARMYEQKHLLKAAGRVTISQ